MYGSPSDSIQTEEEVMADIEAIRKAIDEHLALYVVALGTKADADVAVVDAKESYDQAEVASVAAIGKATRVHKAALEKAEEDRDKVAKVEYAKVEAAQAIFIEAEKASEAFRVKVKEELGVELPTYGKATSGGSTRL